MKRVRRAPGHRIVAPAFPGPVLSLPCVPFPFPVVLPFFLSRSFLSSASPFPALSFGFMPRLRGYFRSGAFPCEGGGLRCPVSTLVLPGPMPPASDVPEAERFFRRPSPGAAVPSQSGERVVFREFPRNSFL